MMSPHRRFSFLNTTARTRFPVSTAHGASDEDATVGASISSGPLDWLWEGFNGTIMAMGAQVKAILGHCQHFTRDFLIT